MNTSQPRYDLDRVVRLGLTVGGLIAFVWLVRFLAGVLIPFVIALLLAYLVNPLVGRVERRVRSRSAATLLTVAILAVLLTTAVVVVIPLIAGEIGRFQDTIGQLRDESSALASRIRRTIQNPQDARLAWLVERIREFLVSDDFKSLLARTAQAVAPTAWVVVAGAINALFALSGVILALLYLVFLLIDYPQVSRTWKNYLPPAYKQPILDFFDEFHSAMRRYFRGQAILALITAVLFGVGFHLISLPMGILLGLLIGGMNMVPYLSSLALLPAAALAVVRAVEQQSSVWLSLTLVFGVFAAIQWGTDWIIAPRIVGRATGLRPVVIMLSVFIWGRLLGFVGVFLAIPLTCMGLAYYRRFVLEPRMESARP